MRIMLFALLLITKFSTAQPAVVNDYIKAHLPSWQLCRNEDYPASFWSFYSRESLPFFTAVDINDDNRVDYGVLIRQRQEIRLLIILSDHAGYTHYLSDTLAGTTLDYCLLPAPPGRIDIAFPAISSLILTANGINLMKMENRMCIYYWNGASIDIFKTL
ncbi:hypothetical protein [Chitinophaga rhizophila]|uniref:Uncharacterized protein n=1 Tax=Chitinophaga rhizophila TaxID=2866212 RepID=A0ABS7GBB9_9BACT|nr:hypothetical protein [Chitinophaga rhizophila]MBW8684967.1 hypothetical protein [Chitinophaga rhizophila]